MISSLATIHETAVIDDRAVINEGVVIGPYCCIGPDVVLGQNVKLVSHVVIQGNTTIGRNSTVFSFASLGLEPQDLKYHQEASRLEIGEETVIREGVTASIGTESGGMITRIGSHCLIMAYCHIAHDCIIGDHVILTNGANLSGHVHVGDYAIIGGMCAVKQFIRIGKHAMIGGFSGVDRDVIPYGLVRSKRTSALKGINIVGLKRRNFSLDDISGLVDTYKKVFSDDNYTLFSERLEFMKKECKGNVLVADIIEFLENSSKNSLCTVVPTDKD